MLINTKLFNVGDFVAIGLLAFIFIWAANWGLKKAGMGQYATTNS